MEVQSELVGLHAQIAEVKTSLELRRASSKVAAIKQHVATRMLRSNACFLTLTERTTISTTKVEETMLELVVSMRNWVSLGVALKLNV